MTIYIYKDMITNILKKRVISILIIFLISCFCFNCKQDNSTLKTKTDSQKFKVTDTLYFSTDNVFEESWQSSNKENGNIYRLVVNKKDSSYYVNNYLIKNNQLLSKGKLVNLLGENPFKAKYEGEWFYYGDGDIGFYKTGNYKNGTCCAFRLS